MLEHIRREVSVLLKFWRDHSAAAASAGGVSRARQLLELVQLRLGPGKLDPKMYYGVCVYRRDFDMAHKRTFVSDYALGPHLRGGRFSPVPDDKYLVGVLLQASGFPVAEHLALCHHRRYAEQGALLRSPADVERYLSDEAHFPFFAKPGIGINSDGAMLVTGVEGGKVMLASGDSLSTQSFAETCFDSDDGAVFQQALEPHPEIAAAFGPRLCTVRVMTLLGADGWEPFTALVKLVAPGNMADNYVHTGNVMAGIDLDTGRLREGCTGLGTEHQRVTVFESTGAEFVGFQLPDWQALLEQVRRASRVFPKVALQAWDIALTDRGPVPVEMNPCGGVLLMQALAQSGLLATPVGPQIQSGDMTS